MILIKTLKLKPNVVDRFYYDGTDDEKETKKGGKTKKTRKRRAKKRKTKKRKTKKTKNEKKKE